jgi:peptide/nickel transport system substrate-binding protein
LSAATRLFVGRQTIDNQAVLRLRFAPAILTIGCVCASVGAGACARPDAARGPQVTLEAGTGWDRSARSSAKTLKAFLEFFYAEPLVGLGWEGRPTSRLAENWEWLDGHTRLRLHLRRDVTFHDGTPLTAATVVEFLRRQQYEFVTSIEADDDHTATLTLSRPDAFLLERLIVPIIPSDRPYVGTGPYRLVTPTELVTQIEPARLEAFNGYYRGRPSVDQIRVHIYESQRAAWAAMLRGEVDYLHDVSRDAADFVEAQSNVGTYRYLAPYYLPIVFNLQHPVLRKPEVRRAINEAIDRQQIVTMAMRGRAVAADGPLWPHFWAMSAAQPTYTFNREAANIRLDAAGYPVRPAVDATHMAQRFHFTCLYWNEGPQYERIALVVQRQLFEVGIDVEMRPVPVTELMAKMGAGDYDAIMMQLSSGRALDWIDRFWHSRNQSQGLMSHYSSADGVLDRLRLATSEDETRRDVAELQRVLHDDPPAAFLVWLMNARAVSRRFDVGAEPDRDILSNLRQWRAAPPPVQASR